MKQTESRVFSITLDGCCSTRLSCLTVASRLSSRLANCMPSAAVAGFEGCRRLPVITPNANNVALKDHARALRRQFVPVRAFRMSLRSRWVGKSRANVLCARFKALLIIRGVLDVEDAPEHVWNYS